MLCKCYWIVLYIVHVTAFCLGGDVFFRTWCMYVCPGLQLDVDLLKSALKPLRASVWEPAAWEHRTTVGLRGCRRTYHSIWLKSVDYAIWVVLQEQIYRCQIRGFGHLKERLIEEWSHFDQNIIDRAVNQWRSSCVNVSVRNGTLWTCDLKGQDAKIDVIVSKCWALFFNLIS